MREAWICDTPYQLFVCANMIYNQKNDNYKVLFVGHKSEYIEVLENRIRELDVFDEVYSFNALEKEEGERHYIKKIYETKFLRHRLKRQWEEYDENVVKNPFDVIYGSMLTPFVKTFAMLNQPSNIDFFEDAMGGYVKDPIKLWNREVLLGKLVGNDYTKLNYRNLYLFDPNLFLTKTDCALKKIPIDNSRERSLFLERIFEKKGSLKSKVIYLNQVGCYSKNKKVENELFNYLENNDIDYLIRLHPAEDKYLYGERKYDDNNTIWELLAKDIDENTILITHSSAAAFTAKWIYGKEPYIIILNELISVNNLYNDKIQKFIIKIKESYINKDKIFVPKTIKELNEFIRNCVS